MTDDLIVPPMVHDLTGAAARVVDLIVPTPGMPTFAVLAKAEMVAKVDQREQALIDAPAITDPTTLTAVRKVVKDAKTLWNDIEASRQMVKAPYLDACTKIDAAARPLLARLQAIIDEGKNQQGEYIIERDRLLAEEEANRKLAEIAAMQDTSRPTAPLIAPSLPSPIDAPLQSRPRVEVVDPVQLPREYLMPNYALITADALAGKAIPGVVVHRESIIVAR